MVEAPTFHGFSPGERVFYRTHGEVRWGTVASAADQGRKPWSDEPDPVWCRFDRYADLSLSYMPASRLCRMADLEPGEPADTTEGQGHA